MVKTYIGPKEGDIAHVETKSRHEKAFIARDWKWIGSLGVAKIRALAPKGTKLPANCKAGRLADLVTAALMATGRKE